MKSKGFAKCNINKVGFLNAKNTLTINNLNINLIQFNSYYSKQYNFTKISYQFRIFDSINNTIVPSDLTLNYNLHILCFLNVNDTFNIYSLASIIEDEDFKCVEFFNINESVKIGFLIYETKSNALIKEDYVTCYIDKVLFNLSYKNDDIFDSSKILNQYKLKISKIYNDNNNLTKRNRLKKLYISKPICSLKRNFYDEKNNWNFLNIFNEYFCFCIGINCLKQIISEECKYYFYLYLIDKNKYLYKKTHYLLMDFILQKYSSDDVYPIFEEMINKNLSAHYLTEKKEILEKYCLRRKSCDLVIYADIKSYKINGDFLERHLTLILKLRQVISSVGVNINFINNLFYNVDYITYICIGHGVSYFKYYLYKDYYGPNNFDKLLIPNSEKLISVVIKSGWKDTDLIKLNLPRWEKYNVFNKSIIEIGNIRFNYIFIMFTWRELSKDGNISLYYIQNIIKLLTNKLLINNLLKHNITLYFTLHHKILKYKDVFKNLSNIIYIEENDIAECLSKTSLIVTDYSSIIFDMIYRRKPFIIFIPDAKDPMIKQNYLEFAYDIIKKFKLNYFKFKNIYFDIKSTVNRINYYIDNDFKLDRKMVEFYDEFNFKNGPIINEFINYILKLNYNDEIF